MHISAILLAAGLSKRFNGDKLFAEYRSKTLLQRAVDLLLTIPVDERIIVTTTERARIIDIPADMLILNNNPEDGIGSSIRLGTQRAGGTHYLYLHADQPDLTADEIFKLIDCAAINQDKIIYPTVDNKPCAPVIFPAKYREELMMLTGDTGGRALRDKYSDDCFTYAPSNPGRYRDIDTPEDIAVLKRIH